VKTGESTTDRIRKKRPTVKSGPLIKTNYDMNKGTKYLEKTQGGLLFYSLKAVTDHIIEYGMVHGYVSTPVRNGFGDFYDEMRGVLTPTAEGIQTSHNGNYWKWTTCYIYDEIRGAFIAHKGVPTNFMPIAPYAPVCYTRINLDESIKDELRRELWEDWGRCRDEGTLKIFFWRDMRFDFVPTAIARAPLDLRSKLPTGEFYYAEDIGNSSDDWEKFREVVQNGVRIAADGSVRTGLAARMLDVNSPFARTSDTLLSIAGVPFITRGNLSCLKGAPKAGKSTINSVIVAVCESGVPYLNIEGRKLDVLFIDTEQSEEQSIYVAQRAKMMAGVNTLKNVQVQWLRMDPPKTRMKFIEEALDEYRPDLVLLDGVSDLATLGVNDAEEAQSIVTTLTMLCTEYRCAMLAVIHTNTSDDAGKARGHLGSELERKCESVLTLTKDSDTEIFTLAPAYMRGGNFPKFNFRMDARKIPYLTDDEPMPKSQKSKSGRPHRRAQTAEEILFHGMELGKEYTKQELEKIVTDGGRSDRSFRDALSKLMNSFAIVHHTSTDKYYLRETEAGGGA